MDKMMDALLGKTFKSSKLKAALNIAKYRIALLKCHRQSRYNHACCNVINMLKLGQTERAILRVEEVIEEKNMLDVFGMIETYCELLSERVRLIKLERDCPDELKDAVTSLIYAASRSEDFPELKKISKKLASRYGKEFTALAIEKPTNTGMVRKLSTRFPTMENRMKALYEIAYENNIILQLDGSTFVSEEREDRGMEQRRVKLHPLAHFGCCRIEEENSGMPNGIGKYKRLSGSVKAMENMPSPVAAASRWWNFPGLHPKRGIFSPQYGIEVADHTNKLPTCSEESPRMLQRLSVSIPSLKNKMKSKKKTKSESNIVWQFEGASFLFEEDRKENQSRPKVASAAHFGSSTGSINAVKKYRDAADAVYEAAAHSVIYAKAASEPCQPQSYNYRYPNRGKLSSTTSI